MSWKIDKGMNVSHTQAEIDTFPLISGLVVWNSTELVIQVCDGTQWVNIN